MFTSFMFRGGKSFSLPNIWELFYIIFSNIPESPLQGPTIQVSCEFLSSVIFPCKWAGLESSGACWFQQALGKWSCVLAFLHGGTVTEGTKADVWSRLLVVLLQISMWESLQEKKFKHWIDILFVLRLEMEGKGD